MRRRTSQQRGEGQLGCIFGLIVLLAASYVAFKMIPVKIRAVELRDEITDTARAAGMYQDAQIRKNILAKAEELDLPLDKSDLIVRRGNNRIYIEATYTVPVEFPGFTYEWTFNHVAQNPIF